MGLEVVRMAANEHYPGLMPTSYTEAMASEPRPFGTLDVMGLAVQVLANNKTLAINGEQIFSFLTSSSGVRSSALWFVAMALRRSPSTIWQTRFSSLTCPQTRNALSLQGDM